MLNVQNGDLDGLGILFERHHVSLSSFLKRFTNDHSLSEDLVQETFCRILHYRDTFKPSKNFRAWMFQIARNLFYSEARKPNQVATASQIKVLPDLTDATPAPQTEAESSDNIRLLHQVLDTLPSEQKELILLSRFEELPHSEIAAILQCSVGAVRVRLFRALKSLQEIYEKTSGDIAS
ncbi:RNA polymerase sigma factor [Puniceicoccaceae bacterium K14]|nr:RNA polymerase sigma factor [Puniceicoccaceae bacterium K14]